MLTCAQFVSSKIVQILEALKSTTARNEDGREMFVACQNGATISDILQYELNLGFALLPDLHMFLSYCDGMQLFSEPILSIREQQHFKEVGLITIHSWGNGDFDCIAVNSCKYEPGTIVFINHDPTVSVAISTSFGEWLVRVANEIQEKGTVLHPRDYRTRNESGLYAHVLRALNGIDCELND